MGQRGPELPPHPRPLTRSTLRLGVPGLRIDLDVPPRFVETATTILGGLEAAREGAPDVRFRIRSDGRATSWLSEDGSTVFGGPDDDVLVELVTLIGRRVAQQTALHATTLARGRAGVALLGPSGSGKSTAGVALLRSGWSLLAEDVTVIDRDGALAPFHRPVSLDRTALDLLGVTEPDGYGPSRAGTILLPPDSLGSRARGVDELSLVAIVDRGGEDADDLPLLDVLADLLTGGLVHLASLDDLVGLVEVLASARRARLDTSDLTTLPARVDELLEDPVTRVDPFVEVRADHALVIDGDEAVVVRADRVHRLNATAAAIWLLHLDGLDPAETGRRLGLAVEVVMTALAAAGLSDGSGDLDSSAGG